MQVLNESLHNDLVSKDKLRNAVNSLFRETVQRIKGKIDSGAIFICLDRFTLLC